MVILMGYPYYWAQMSTLALRYQSNCHGQKYRPMVILYGSSHSACKPTFFYSALALDLVIAPNDGVFWAVRSWVGQRFLLRVSAADWASLR